MLLSEIVTNVKTRLGSHPVATTALIESIANDEMKELAKSFYFDVTEFEESVNSVIDTATLTITTNATYFIIDSIYDSTNEYALEARDKEWYDSQLNYDEESVPVYFVQRLGGVYLYPTPDAVNAYKVRGRKVPATITSAVAPTYPEEWHYVIEAKTASRIASMLKMMEVMMTARNDALSRISEITENRTIRRRNIQGQIRMERRGGSY